MNKRKDDLDELFLPQKNTNRDRRSPWYRNLVTYMVVAIVTGLALGYFYPNFAVLLSPLSIAFIKMIKSLVGLIIFCTIVVGIANIGSSSSVGRIGIKSIIYFELMTTLAMFFSLVTMNIFKPGKGMNIDVSSLDVNSISSFISTTNHHSAIEWILSIIPDTFISAFTNGNLLPVLLMASLFGLALLKMEARRLEITTLIDRFSEALFIMVGMVMKFAPITVMGAISFTIGKYGISSIFPLLKLLLVFYLSCVFFISIVLGSICVYSKINIFKLIKYLKCELLVAFGTASSEAVLPSMIKKLQEIGVKKHIVGFVIPAGFSFNLDGSSLYFIMAILFISQACNIPLSFHQEIMLILIFMVTSKGIAGVAGSGFVTLASTLVIYPHVPLAGIVLLLGIDRFMDSMRTVTNLMGNAVATLVIARSENGLDGKKLHLLLNKDLN